MESADLDQEFLTKFSCMGTTDRDVLVNDLHSLLGSQLSREGCAFFLDMTNWNIQAAVGAYYDFYGSQPPQMVLVQDVTIGIGESIAPRTEFSKSWRVKNSGSEAWPSGVHLCLKSGEAMSGPTSIILPCLQPGEETSVSVRLMSPAVPGLYQSHWRACTMSGSMFGDVIWVIVSVEEGGVLGLTQQLSAISTQDSGHQMDSGPQMDSSTLERTVTGTPHNPFGSPHSMLPEGSSPGSTLHHENETTVDSRTGESASRQGGGLRTVSSIEASSIELQSSHTPADFTSGSTDMQSS